MRHHPPLLSTVPPLGRCLKCGGDPLDEIHWPPRGWRERLLALVGLY